MFISRIRDLREDSDKTQKEIANELNMSLKTYCNYERGVRVAPLDFMIKIARYYNTSLDYFAGFIDVPRKLK